VTGKQDKHKQTPNTQQMDTYLLALLKKNTKISPKHNLRELNTRPATKPRHSLTNTPNAYLSMNMID